MYDLTHFTAKQMTECCAAVRELGVGSASMEEATNRVVRYFFEHLVVQPSGRRACALDRFFKTHPLASLGPALQTYAKALLPTQPPSGTVQCLTLLATAGERPEWNARAQSKGHQAIPLASEAAVAQAPMIATLIKQFGVDVGAVVRPEPNLLLDLSQRTFNVFHVPDAQGSPYIPAQREFVIPCGIRSVLGMGGVLPSGSLFAVILFSRQAISRGTAELFKPMALNIKMAVLPFESAVFASSGRDGG